MFEPQESSLSSFCSTFESLLSALPIFPLMSIPHSSLFRSHVCGLDKIINILLKLHFFFLFRLCLPVSLPLHLFLSLSSCLIRPPSSSVCLLTAKVPCSLPWPGIALDERSVARALFQRCLLLHPCSPWTLSCSCQADGKKEGKERRLRKQEGNERKGRRGKGWQNDK